MQKIFSNNRKKFVQQMMPNSILILLSGEEISKRGDELYPFVPKRNFYYLTGLDVPKIILIIHKKNNNEVVEALFLERFDPVQAKWVGEVLSSNEAEAKSGINNSDFVDNLKTYISKVIFSNNIENVYMDLENRYWDSSPSEDVQLANELKTRYPYINLINAYYIFAGLRMIKSKDEVKLIKKAINITNEGLNLMMKNLHGNMYEYELEAYFDYTLKKNGTKDRAFTTIAASGKNATILHYTKNDCKMNDGDLVLLDLGAQIGYYSADITRTFPVSGKFSERQKQLYNIVLAGQQKVINSIKPGIPFSDLNEIIKTYYVKELKKIGLIQNKDELSNYYYHGIGHMLGLETHDIGRSHEGIITKGMVITVEPGLYIEEENIGIRIEDDVYVTDKGCEVLSKDIIKSVEDIEAFMAN